MTVQTKTVLKSYFQTGDKPTQTQFGDLIDSYQDTSALLTSIITAASAGTGLLAITSANGAVLRQRSMVDITDFGGIGNASTFNTPAIQTALATLASGGTVFFPMTSAGGTYNTSALTVNNDKVRLLLDSGVTLSFPTLGSGVNAVTVSANNFTFEGGILKGPSVSAYVANENGVYITGASTSARRSGLNIIGTEIRNFGYSGVFAKWTDEIRVSRAEIHDIGYAGTQFLSCNIGSITNSKAHTITPGTGGQMYGFQLSHDSTNYNIDPNAGTKDAANPFCWGWLISDNEAYSIDWTAIDNHGGYQINIHNNITWGAKIGISLGKSSGDATAYAGWDNSITGNILEANNPNGSVSGNENGALPGLACGGGSTVNQQRLIVANNIIRNYGNASNTGATCIAVDLCDETKVIGNLIENWNGVGVYCATSNIQVENNFFGSMQSGTDTAALCISAPSGTSKRITLNGNTHYGTNNARAGLSLSGSTTPILSYGFNDFRGATVRQVIYGAAGQQSFGAGISNVITATDGDNTPSIGTLLGGGRGTLLFNTVASAYNITTLTNGLNGQVVDLVNTATTAVTLVQGATMKLPAGANLALGQFDCVSLYNNVGVYYALSNSNNA